MRVLHITAGNLYGGIETLLVTLARYRALCLDMDQEFAVCSVGRLSAELEALGAQVYKLGAMRLRNPFSIVRARQRIEKVLTSGRYDVAICHHVLTQAIFAPVVRAHRLPLAFWAHSTLSGRHWTERIAGLTTPDLVIYSSRFTSEAVPRIYQNVATEVIYPLFAAPNTVDTRAQIRAEFGTPDEAVVIVQASRLQEWKGHRVLLEALACLEGNPSWECWIAGGPQRRGETRYLRNLVETAVHLKIAERVRFLGQRDDVPRLLAAADIYCQPNTAPEPFGLAFIEALNAGLPVVATALGGPLEILDKSCGIIVPSNNPGELAGALSRLISDRNERMRLGQAGPTRAAYLCNPTQQLARMYRVLSGVSSSSALSGQQDHYVKSESHAAGQLAPRR